MLAKSLSEVLHVGILFKSFFKALEMWMLRLTKASVLASILIILASIICRRCRGVVSWLLIAAISLILRLTVLLLLFVHHSRSVYQTQPTVSRVFPNIVLFL